MREIKHLQIRITRELHDEIRRCVIDVGQTIQEWLSQLIENELKRKKDKE